MNNTPYRLEVRAEEASRIDTYLADQFQEISRSQIKKIIDAGEVLLDGSVVEKAGTLLKPGSIIEIKIPEEEGDGLIPEAFPLDILYEDEHVIVVNKPAGMVVHPGAGISTGTLVNALLAHFPPIRHVGERERPGVVHRLDKETSGALIFAKTDKAYKWLVRQFKSRELDKTYLALVDGHPPTPTGRIDAPITRDTRNRTQMAVGLRGQGKAAVSEYFTREQFVSHTYLEVHPITGRTHQIRVHLSYIGVPVVGDTVYGRHHPSIELERFFLHAKSLAVKLLGERVPRIFNAPLSEDLQGVLDSLRNKER
jgi:23S rRNA pseudouridine1911/1915/1917 synthase